MVDLALKQRNIGFFEFQIWRDKKSGVKMDVRDYAFRMSVWDEKEDLHWQFEKATYEEGDKPEEGYFRIPYDTGLTNVRGTYIFRVDMLGSSSLTIVDGNLVVV